MIVCPVCEHAQPSGAECEVCGKLLVAESPFVAAESPFVAAESPFVVAESPFVVSLSNHDRLDGLEPTLHVFRQAQDEREREDDRTAAAELLADLEPTAVGAGAGADGGAPTPVPDLVPTALSDLPGDGPTPEPVAVLCRYCRSPAMPGERICGHCGMRLPVAALRAPPAAALPRCRCGLPVSGSVCPGCGARLAADS
jgi:hypothetical protein